jgi:uncharacterized membrane protein YfcA
LDAVATNLAFIVEGTSISLAVFAVLCGSAFLGSLIAASIGLGGGIFLLSVMSVVLPPAILIPIHGVAQLGSNVGRAIILARLIDLRFLLPFAIGTLIGSLVGANLFVALPAWLLQIILALFVLYATWSPGFRATKLGRKTFLGVGFASGFVTLFIGGSAPLVAPFVRAATKERRAFVSTLAAMMVLQHGVKIAAFGMLGFAFGTYLPVLVGLVACGFLGTVSGRLLLDKLPERVFSIGLKIVLTGLAIRLLTIALAHVF